jgi:predicted metal-dependent peptidase
VSDSSVRYEEEDRAAVTAMEAALRRTSMLLPHLVGLGRLIHIVPDYRVSTAGIFASGRLMVNPNWFLKLDPAARIFVAAHELLHLALRTHERSVGSDALTFNIAHDYIINDMLRVELGIEIPGQGLDWPGARSLSAEKIATELRAGRARGEKLPTDAWSRPSRGTLGDALSRAGLDKSILSRVAQPACLDALEDELERRWFPNHDPITQSRAKERIVAEGDRALALGAWRNRTDAAFAAIPPAAGGDTKSAKDALIRALDARFRPAWELALQRWIEDIAPGPRSYGHASRRQGDRTDIVVVGRRREGWILNLVLDTSRSMTSEFASILGLLKAFCVSAGVAAVRILQCDDELQADDLIEIDALDQFRVIGLQGSDLSPAMRQLARDPQIEAALVISDGFIAYPPEPMPYLILWAIIGNEPFSPPFGRVLHINMKE